jgi:two-component system chemotaxis sensor kinase CheA
VQRLDELVRLVGEASAAALRVGRLVTDELGVEPAGVPELHDLTRALESLQERTLQARMVPFATVAEPLRRAGRDLARSLGKAIDVELRGQDTELDRGVLERIADPCSTWSATPSTTASSHPGRGCRRASRSGARSGSTRPSSAPRSW